MLLADHGRKLHRLFEDFASFEQRLRVLEERVAKIETNFAELVKVISDG
jgi:hypothetical protein